MDLRHELDKLESTRLFDIAHDIDIEERKHNLNDYSRSELMDVIVDWVMDGVKIGNWTVDGWIADVLA